MDDITSNARSEEIVVYDGRKLKLIIFPGKIQTVSRTFTYLMDTFIRVLTSSLNLEDLKHRSRDSTRPVLKLMVYTNENLFLYRVYDFWAIQTLRL